MLVAAATATNAKVEAWNTNSAGTNLPHCSNPPLHHWQYQVCHLCSKSLFALVATVLFAQHVFRQTSDEVDTPGNCFVMKKERNAFIMPVEMGVASCAQSTCTAAG